MAVFSYSCLDLYNSTYTNVRFLPHMQQIHTYVQVLLHSHIRTSIATFTHTYKYCYIHTYVQVLLHSHIRTSIATFTHTYKYCYIHTYVQVLLHSHIRTSTATFTHTYKYCYIHTYVQVFRGDQSFQGAPPHHHRQGPPVIHQLLVVLCSQDLPTWTPSGCTGSWFMCVMAARHLLLVHPLQGDLCFQEHHPCPVVWLQARLMGGRGGGGEGRGRREEGRGRKGREGGRDLHLVQVVQTLLVHLVYPARNMFPASHMHTHTHTHAHTCTHTCLPSSPGMPSGPGGPSGPGTPGIPFPPGTPGSPCMGRPSHDHHMTIT